ncbi:hypothetical protein [Pseudomonas sp. TTU2014-080ASC]|uniref:hypothetical protein n=1 Tax=Pseudomonas sp. TTU2014-080ASC TaxID=1729724 RepID=UPI000718550F|nr:hypothetical protein [Pseudomonas sp. TTU2014-080ASC]KRW62837.1 hypothetical protein AO726_05325 [Pseudomonas sp. TTU2014-080ASC]
MNNLIKQLLVLSTLFLPPHVQAQEPIEDNSLILEKASVTIRMMNNNPYAELRLCEGCPLRLLPFTRDAQIYLKGQRQTKLVLSDGQVLLGTVFVQSKPVDSISEIVAL